MPATRPFSRRSLAPALAALVLAAPLAHAEGDMLKPNELQTTGVSDNPANDNGAYLGAGLAFGQSRTTESGASPGVGYLLKVEPGYQMRTGTWNRLEFSADLMFGSLSFRMKDADGGKITMPVGLGVLPKIGYGYSLGTGMFAMCKVGAGPMMAKYKGSAAGTSFSSETLTGIAYHMGWLMVIPMGDTLAGTAGLSWTHAQFDVDEVKFGGTKVSVDRNVIANFLAAEAGLRLRF